MERPKSFRSLMATAIDADADEWSTWTEYVSTFVELMPRVEPSRDWVWREAFSLYG